MTAHPNTLNLVDEHVDIMIAATDSPKSSLGALSLSPLKDLNFVPNGLVKNFG